MPSEDRVLISSALHHQQQQVRLQRLIPRQQRVGLGQVYHGSPLRERRTGRSGGMEEDKMRKTLKLTLDVRALYGVIVIYVENGEKKNI